MFKRLLHSINRETSGLHQAAYLLAFFSIGSQILGVLRDRILAASLGAGQSLDIYYASFRIPDLIFITVGSMVSVSVLMPFLAEKMKIGEDEGRRFLNNIFLFFFSIILVTSLIAFIAMRPLSELLFPGFSADQLTQLVSLTRVMLLSPIFLGLSNIFGTLTQTYKRFLLYSLSPILYNAGIIAGILLLYPRLGLIGLVYGVVAGSLLHFAIQLPFIIEHRFLPKIHLKWNFAEIKKTLMMSIPRTLTLSADTISVMLLLSLASLMAPGSISIFNFAYNLESFLLSAIGVSYSLAIFPILIKLHSEMRSEEFSQQTASTAQHMIFWSIPIATLFIALRNPIVQVILGSGEFDLDQVKLTAAAFAAFLISIACQNLTLLFVRAYYATGNTIKPLIAKLSNAVTTVALSYLFMNLFQSSPAIRAWSEQLFGISGPALIVVMLPLGWSVGEILNTIALWIVFERDFGNFSRPVLRTLLEVVIASVGIGISANYGLTILAPLFTTGTTLNTLLYGLCAGVPSILVGIAILTLLKSRELASIMGSIKTRMTRR